MSLSICIAQSQTVSVPLMSRHVGDEWPSLRASSHYRVGERLVLGESNVSTAGGGDLNAAGRVAREMVYRCGFSAKLGPVSLMDREEVYLGRSRCRFCSCDPNLYVIQTSHVIPISHTSELECARTCSMTGSNLNTAAWVSHQTAQGCRISRSSTAMWLAALFTNAWLCSQASRPTHAHQKTCIVVCHRSRAIAPISTDLARIAQSEIEQVPTHFCGAASELHSAPCSAVLCACCRMEFSGSGCRYRDT